MENTKLFVTGFLRSGTTLLEKRLLSDLGYGVLSQPLPLLFVEMKRRFLEQRGCSDVRYPLGHLFNDVNRLDEFTGYLDTELVPSGFIEDALVKMHGYTGCLTQEVFDIPLPQSEMPFVEWYDFFIDKTTSSLWPGNHHAIVGSKEVFSEEYVPYFLRHHVRGIVIVRDPRNVVRSIVGDDAEKYTSNKLSLLHVVRQWRKSVAIKLEFECDQQFHSVIFEELVENPSTVVTRIARWVGDDRSIDDQSKDALKDQYGRKWRGNSSFAGNREKKELPIEIEKVVELLCFPEMKALGYGFRQLMRIPDFVEFRRILESFGIAPHEYEMEWQRISYLRNPQQVFDIEKWFVGSKVYESLAEVVNYGQS